MNQEPITIEAIVNAPIEQVWQCWNEPKYITKWAFASEDWEAPAAENDLREGGRFSTTMAAKDKSSSFNFTGVYTEVQPYERIAYDMDQSPTDEHKRHVKILFSKTPEGVRIVQTFDPEQENPVEMQRAGWQSILNNFKAYVERGA